MSVLLRRPSPERLASWVLTYREVGATSSELPPGYRHVESRQRLGQGGAVYGRCVDAVLSWRMHRDAGLHVHTSTATAQVGTDVALLVGGDRFGLVAPCRVVYVVDEPSRRGFAYGTLPGHPESGEESFVVELDDDGVVWMGVRAFSRPANALSRLAGPVARRVQDGITARYLAALGRVADR